MKLSDGRTRNLRRETWVARAWIIGAVLLVVTAVLIFASTSNSQTTMSKSRLELRVHKSTSVLDFFRTYSWLPALRQDRCVDVPWTRSCLVARERIRFHRARLRSDVQQLELYRIPRGEQQIRAYILARVGEPSASCLSTIIEWETGGTWDPTIDYGFGHGNVNEAYGLPQALPGTKMASAGADWRWNPKTQIEWMIRYANERYGSPCGAFASRRDAGTY